MLKLNNKGFTHDILIVFFVIIFAIAGVGYLVISRAATSTYTSSNEFSKFQYVLGSGTTTSLTHSQTNQLLLQFNRGIIGYHPTDMAMYQLTLPANTTASSLTMNVSYIDKGYNTVFVSAGSAINQVWSVSTASTQTNRTITLNLTNNPTVIYFGIKAKGSSGSVSGTFPANRYFIVNSYSLTGTTTTTSPAPTPQSGPSYYISTTGSDSNPGTQSSPWLTLNHAASAVATPGSTVMLMAGTYTQDVNISKGGSAGTPITYESYPGQTATVVGRLRIARGADYVTIQNLTLVGNPNNPSDLPSPEINANHVTIANNDISNAHTAICLGIGSEGTVYGTGNYATITGNRIHDCGVLPALNHEHGIYVEDATNLVIDNNQIYNNADRGIQFYPDLAGSVIDQVDVYHNVIEGNGEGILFSGNNGYSASNINVHNNLITFSAIRNNVESYYPSGTNPGTGNIVQSNCIYGGVRDSGNGGIDASSGGFSLVNNTVADPLYINRAAQNYGLQTGSPCAAIFSNTNP
jgi:hypothetical protein